VIIAGYEITEDQYKALDHALKGSENPEQWIARVASLESGARSIANKIKKCVSKYAATPTELRTTRVERDAQQEIEDAAMAEIAQAELTAREKRAARIRKVTEDAGITLKTDDLKAALAALAEASGVEL